MFKISSSVQETSSHLVIPCIYHPNKLIQNFCMNEECLLPMCSICIGLHVCQHQNKGTFSNLCSIDEAIKDVKKGLEDFCCRLQEISQTYASNYKDKQKMEEKCRKTLANLKFKVMNEIQIQFISLESKITQQLLGFDEKIHKKYCQISEQSEQLYDYFQSQLCSLSSQEKMIKTIIKYYSEQHKVKNDEILFRLQQKIEDLKKEEIHLFIKPLLDDVISQIGGYVTCSQYEETFKKSQELPITVSTSSKGINFSYASKST